MKCALIQQNYCTQHIICNIKNVHGLLLNKARPGTSFQLSKSKPSSNCFYIPLTSVYPLYLIWVLLLLGVFDCRSLAVNSKQLLSHKHPNLFNYSTAKHSIFSLLPQTLGHSGLGTGRSCSSFQNYLKEVIKSPSAPTQSFARKLALNAEAKA